MNYLAHLRLSPTDALSRAGSLLGDFRRGVLMADIPAALRPGVEHHLRLDAFTDNHEVFRISRQRLGPDLARYSGVLVDVFYDHFLARNWDRYGDGRSLRHFCDEVYGQLEPLSELLPAAMRRAMDLMQRHDWLGSYAEVEGIEEVLRRMAGRLRRSNPLATAAGLLTACYDKLEADFGRFFPQAEAHMAAGER